MTLPIFPTAIVGSYTMPGWLERLKTEYKGIHGLGPDRFDPILPAARRRRKPDDFRCDLAV